MKKELIFLVLILLALPFLSAEENGTSNNETIEDSINDTIVPDFSVPEGLYLDLDAQKYAKEKNIEGSLKVDFFEDLDPNEEISITIDGSTDVFTIEDILKKANLSISYSNIQFEAINGESQKTLSFTNAGNDFVGIQIPRFAEVQTVSFTVLGSIHKDSFPTRVTIDIGNENTKDWSYTGTFAAFTGVEVSSKDLDDTPEGTGFIEGSDTYYCEFINLPFGEKFKISSDYTKLGSNGDIHASILSVPTNNPEWGWTGGSDFCNLPESSGSCEIELDYPIEGEHLVCIYSTGGFSEDEQLYSLPLDNSENTDTAFTCPTTEGSLCEATGFSNFFITIQGGIYDDSLSTEANIEDWETFSGSTLTGLQYYVGTEPFSGVCKASICNIPLNISSTTAGNVTIKDLASTYDFGGIVQVTNTFYDLEYPQAQITAIESQILNEGASIELDLTLFELNVDSLGEKSIEIQFLNDTTSDSFEIVNEEDLLDAKTLIETATAKYKGFLDQATEEYQVLLMLDKIQKIERLVEDLAELKKQVGFTDEKILINDIEAKISDEPWDLNFYQTVSITQRNRPEDIPSDLGDPKEVFFMQDLIEVIGTSKKVDVEIYSGEKETHSYIKKEVNAIQSVEGILFEDTPILFTSLSSSERAISSDGNRGEFEISITQGGKKDYYYLTSEEIDILNFKSFIVTDQEIEVNIPEPISSFCGDGICSIDETESSCAEDCKESSRFPWIFIIIVIVILATIVFFGLSFSRKKRTKRFLTPVQKPIIKQQPVQKPKPVVRKPEKPKGRGALFRR
jgi:hypothetical protein